jgi:hypothetical protein
MAAIRCRYVPPWQALLAGALLLLGGSASALTPPRLRWEILPGPSAAGVPIASDEQLLGPIGDNVSNVAYAGLTHNGITNVGYGSGSVESTTVVDAATLIGTPLCSPAPCAASTAIWSDTAKISAVGIADGTPGSLTAQILRLGNLTADVPHGWITYAGTNIAADYGVRVYVNGALRDRVAPICVATPDQLCTRIGLQRSYYPEGSQTPSITSIGFDDPIPLGPYDFSFGQPLQLEVQLSAHTTVNRGVNNTGTPQAHAVLFASWGGWVEVHDAAGMGGSPIPLGSVVSSVASGRDWVRAPEPERAAAGAAAATALVLLAARRLARPRIEVRPTLASAS